MTERNGEIKELPKGWSVAKLEKVVVDITYGHTAPSKNTPIGPKFLRITDLQNNSVNWDSVPYCSCNELEKYKLKSGDIVVARTGATTGKSLLLREIPETAVFASYLIRLQTSNFCLPKYIALFMQSLNYWQQITAVSKGTAQPGANASILSTLLLSISPLNEQERIVEKIEELFSDLDQGIESLRTAQKQLKVYRQVVLKWAFEGKLTEKWRSQVQQEKLDIKTGEELLAQIKTERESRYQQQLVEWEEAVQQWEAGKQGKKPTKPQKLKALPPLIDAELAELPQLPNGWKWIRYGAMCLQVRNGVSEKPNSECGEKIFRISAVRPFFIDLQDFRYIDNTDSQYNDFLLEKSDILFTRYNGSRKYVGVCAKFSSNERFLYPDKLIKTKLVSHELTLPDYIVFAANVGGSRAYIDKRIRTTAGQSGVSGEDIKSTPLPICSVEEQEQIVQKIESRLSICDQLEATILENLQKAEALRQSILKQAFEGKLVPQDPNDEPAEKLLERIKQEKIKVKKGKQLIIQGI